MITHIAQQHTYEKHFCKLCYSSECTKQGELQCYKKYYNFSNKYLYNKSLVVYNKDEQVFFSKNHEYVYRLTIIGNCMFEYKKNTNYDSILVYFLYDGVQKYIKIGIQTITTNVSQIQKNIKKYYIEQYDDIVQTIKYKQLGMINDKNNIVYYDINYINNKFTIKKHIMLSRLQQIIIKTITIIEIEINIQNVKTELNIKNQQISGGNSGEIRIIF